MKKTLIAFLAALSIGAMETQAQGLMDLFKKTTNTEQNSKLATDQKAQNALSGLSGLSRQYLVCRSLLSRVVFSVEKNVKKTLFPEYA